MAISGSIPACSQADRFFDNYVMTAMQKPVSASRFSGLPSSSGRALTLPVEINPDSRRWIPTERAPDLVQHRFELLLVVGRLTHSVRHHQQASRRHATGDARPRSLAAPPRTWRSIAP